MNGLSRYDAFHIDDYTDVVAAARMRFANRIRQIVGDANVVRLIVPARADTTTTTDLSKNAATCTWDATIAARLSQQGLGYKQTFASASSQFGSLPDAADLSFGTGTADSAFSIVVLANVTDTAADRVLFAKYNVAGTLREYALLVNGVGDTLQLNLYDESADTQPLRTSDAAITMGATHLFTSTYDGTGGATAANGVLLYSDASAIASTATNNAGYVAMENTAAIASVGSLAAAVAGTDGTILMTLLCSVALSATQLTQIKTAVNEFFGLAL